ncbi:eCIS core domain-containing protein [Nostoc sp. UIC 10890]
MHKTKSSKSDSSTYSNSSALNSSPQLAHRAYSSEIQKAPVAAKTPTDIENEAFAEQQMEATGLSIQAKSGTITSAGQERLIVLQAKMDGLLNSRLEHATRFGHNIANIPLRRPDSAPPIQAKLTIGQPGDKYEQEADDTARRVVQRIHQQSSQPVQREAVTEEKELQTKPADNIQRQSSEEEELQMMPMVQCVADGGMAASAEVEAGIQSARGSGQPIAENIREPMEQAFGADFSSVRVHTDSLSDQLNQSIQAKAFTTGQDVFFRQGAYEPGSRGGQELLAHELTHVMQQRGGEVQPTRVINDMVSVKGDLEYEADDIGNRAVEWRDKSIEPLQQSSGVNASVQRKIDKKGEERLNEFKKMKFYTYLTPEHKSLFEAYLRRSENWALGVFLGNIEVNVDNPRQIFEASREDSSESEGEQQEEITNEDVEESTEDSSESEGEQQEEITNEDMAKMLGKANPKKESKPKAVHSARVPRPVIVPTQIEYDQKVNLAAQSVVNQIKLKLDNQGDPYGSIDVTDNWTDYESMGKKKKDYHNDIVNRVKLTYPQSGNNDRPYYNWVYKNNWASNFTKKSKKGDDIKAEVNIHLPR